ncbi:MAG: ISAzo13 family transposase, partial [Actinomycetia bacterium]|nr:ISAzo13 family transposase [Actinomycetes bacterium]
GKCISSGDTPEFAVESVERRWKYEGAETYQNQNEILILADAGGSNGYRPHMWKVGLQKILCDGYGLTVTVCHYPPGASKWNPTEHRLFSEISKNWKGTPLTDYETVLKYTLSTKTTAGLRVNAVLADKKYQKGMKASEKDLEKLNIQRHELNPSWNYTLYPN